MTVSPSPSELLISGGIKRAAMRHRFVWFLAAHFESTSCPPMFS